MSRCRTRCHLPPRSQEKSNTHTNTDAPEVGERTASEPKPREPKPSDPKPGEPKPCDPKPCGSSDDPWNPGLTSLEELVEGLGAQELVEALAFSAHHHIVV